MSAAEEVGGRQVGGRQVDGWQVNGRRLVGWLSGGKDFGFDIYVTGPMALLNTPIEECCFIRFTDKVYL